MTKVHFTDLSIKTFAPDPPLAPYIEVIHIMESGDSAGLQTAKAGPRSALVFICSGEVSILQKGVKYKIPEAALIGPVTQPYTFYYSRNCTLILVEFTETGFYSLFHESPGTLTNSLADLHCIRKPALAYVNILVETIICEKRKDRRLFHIQNFLKGFLPETRGNNVLLTLKTVELIKNLHPPVRMECLNRKLDISNRSLERNFKYVTGLSPNNYVCLIRFTRLFESLLNRDPSNYLDAVYHLGYFDQSHAIRDFHRYAGYSPRDIQPESFYAARQFSRPFCSSLKGFGSIK